MSNDNDHLNLNNLLEVLETISELENENQIINQTNNTMAPPAFDLKLLQIIPEFNGENVIQLHRFLNLSEKILSTYADTVDVRNFQNEIIFHGIISRLTGKAARCLNINPVSTWEELKDTLLLNFGDKRDKTDLVFQLLNMRHKPGQTYLQFFENIESHLEILCQYISLHHNNTAERQLLTNEYTNLALATLLKYVQEPMANYLRNQKPRTLPEAKSIIFTQSQNIGQYPMIHNPQQRRPNQNTNTNIPRQNYQNTNTSVPRQNHQNTNHTFNNQQYRQTFPSQPINNLNPKPLNQRFPTNRQVFGTQNQNVFRPQPNKMLDKPVPMSTTTANTLQRQYFTPASQYQRNNQSVQPRSNGPPRFVSQELYNAETHELTSPDDEENTPYETPINETPYPATYDDSAYYDDNNPQSDNDNFLEMSQNPDNNT